MISFSHHRELKLILPAPTHNTVYALAEFCHGRRLWEFLDEICRHYPSYLGDDEIFDPDSIEERDWYVKIHKVDEPAENLVRNMHWYRRRVVVMARTRMDMAVQRLRLGIVKVGRYQRLRLGIVKVGRYQRLRLGIVTRVCR